MVPTLKNIGATLCVVTFGKAFEVTCIADTDDEANAWCETHPDEGVLDILPDGRVLIAKDAALGDVKFKR